jgi:hypothetical protein
MESHLHAVRAARPAAFHPIQVRHVTMFTAPACASGATFWNMTVQIVFCVVSTSLSCSTLICVQQPAGSLVAVELRL